MKAPDVSEYSEYYGTYVAEVPPGKILDLLEAQGRKTALFLAKINEHTSRHRYADDKWSIREIVCHLADAERIFLNRAVRIARGDTTEMPGFEENDYVQESGADEIPLLDLAADLAAVRASTLSFFRLLTESQSLRTGTASKNPFSVRALAYIIVGHEMHHMDVVRDRYLS